MLLQRSFINKYGFVLLLAATCGNALAQTPKEVAAAKCKEAIKLEDAGNYAPAIKLLEEAQKLDPTNTAYPYEITYAWYCQKQYQKVIDKLETLKDKPDSFDRLYQLLGNSYDILGQGAKAIATYDDGLKKFPKSGCLYLERGVIPLDDKKYEEALRYFEKGIQVAPAFPSNYYWAAKLYINSNEPMWGMIYGELFMNLERNGKRNEEMSELLYNTYKSQITFPEAGNVKVSFAKQAIIDGTKPLKMTYSMIYEPTLGVAVVGETAIDMNALDRIRQNFLKFYYDRHFDKEYPNALFAYQDKITKAECMEAYNHWLLMKGDDKGFNTWRAQNPAKWQDFLKWFGDNPLKLDEGNRFYREQY